MASRANPEKINKIWALLDAYRQRIPRAHSRWPPRTAGILAGSDQTGYLRHARSQASYFR